jgi:hypothetical protein
VPTKTPTTESTPEIEEGLLWEARRRELLARIPPKEERPTRLYLKLAQIASLIGEIPKRGENTFHHYKYVREPDLVEAVRPILAEYGIWLEWTLVWDAERGIVGHQRVPQVLRDRDKNIIGTQDSLTILMAEFWFVDGESGEQTAKKIIPGYGDDTSDKGSNKALTSLMKYFLMKTFLIATGDDPEADNRADERAAARTDQPRVTRSARQGGTAQPKHGGRQQEASSPQIRQLGELLRQTGLAKSSAKTLAYFEEVLERPFPVVDGNPAESLQAALSGDIKPEEMGKLIAGLRARVEAEGQPDAERGGAPDPVAGEPDGDEQEAAVDDEEDAGPAV